MAKTLMVSNSVYDELKKIKTKEDKSFSEVIVGLLNYKRNTIDHVWKHFGVLKGDTEYKEVQKVLREGWRRWQKKYA